MITNARKKALIALARFEEKKSLTGGNRENREKISPLFPLLPSVLNSSFSRNQEVTAGTALFGDTSNRGDDFRGGLAEQNV